MEYIIGDIHGCYKEYMALMEKLNLSEEDEVYILGDAMDVGPEPIKVMQDIMNRFNVIYLLGKHDLVFYLLMKGFAGDINEQSSQMSDAMLARYQQWAAEGGKVTAEQFLRLSKAEKQDMIMFIEETLAFDEVEFEEERYILVHGGLGDAETFDPDKDLEEYELAELTDSAMDYTKRYFDDEDVYVVSGHTPTTSIPGWEKAEVYQENGHIALNTDCVNTGVLAAYCIDTQEVIYVGK